MSQVTDETGRKTWICSDCGYASERKNNMEKHVERKHLHLALSCKFCGCQFKSRTDLGAHENSHLNN